MYADRYQPAGARGGSLVAAATINAAIIAALVFAAPKVTLPDEQTIIGFPVPITPPPPPPPEPQPQKRAVQQPSKPASDPVVDVVKPMADISLLHDAAFEVDVDPSPGRVKTTGTDTGVTLDPPKPAPVLVGAAPDPRYSRDFQPAYPPSERRAGSEGRVRVRVLIGVEGRVIQVEPIEKVSDAFFDVTRRHALARWRFKPATRDGVPYESWREMAVRFVLED